jgi:hypothetical protein
MRRGDCRIVSGMPVRLDETTQEWNDERRDYLSCRFNVLLSRVNFCDTGEEGFKMYCFI